MMYRRKIKPMRWISRSRISTVVLLLCSTLLSSHVVADGSSDIAAATSAIREYVAFVTTQGQGISITQESTENARFARVEKPTLSLITISVGQTNRSVVAKDVRIFAETASVVGKSIAWCEVNISHKNDSLPKCARDTVDVVIGYLSAADSSSVLASAMEDINFVNLSTRSKILSYFFDSIGYVARAYCLGGIAEQNNEIGAIYLLTDTKSFDQHFRCTSFFSFAALGVRPTDLKTLFAGKADEVLASRRLDANAITALRFLYSDAVQSGMDGHDFARALDLWLAGQGN